MSDDQGFLARWSRLKRSAAAKPRAAATPERAEENAPATGAADASPPMPTEPVVDPAALPPVETLDAQADIRAFLAPGVPPDLVRSALRRVWSADPAIRDFIGLSENSWDFNAPDGVPGFGSLTAEDARRLLARVLGEPEEGEPRPAAAHPGEMTQAEHITPTPDNVEARPPHPDPLTEGRGDGSVVVGAPQEGAIATQQESASEDRPIPPRRHGTALPR